MPWSYEQHPTQPVGELVFTGSTSADDIKESTTHLIGLEKTQGINRFLIDTGAMKIDATLVDIFNVAAKQYVEEEADRTGRVAILLPPSPKEREAVEFYETVCRNRGWDVRSFDERPEAIDWLTSDALSDDLD